MYIYNYGSHAGPPITSLNSDPCSIRVSSVAQGSLASLLSGTGVRLVAKEQDPASVPHFLDKPRVHPLPTELQIGSLLPARSCGVDFARSYSVLGVQVTCPCLSNSMDQRCLLDHDERLVVTSVKKEHRVVVPEPHPVLAVRTTEQVAGDADIRLPRNLFVA